MHQFKEIFFDCDGTLVDSEIIAMRVAGEVLAAALKEQNVSIGLDVPEFVQRYAGWHFDQMIDVMEKAHHVKISRERIEQEKVSRTLESLKNTKVIPGIKNVLDTLPALGLDKSLVTSSEFNRVNICLNATGLASHFPEDRKFSAHDTLNPPKHKPASDIYKFALQARGHLPHEVAAVEDSISGVDSAVGADIFTIGYIGASHIAEETKETHAQTLLNRGAQIVISDMNDLSIILENINKPSEIPAQTNGKVFFNQKYIEKFTAATTAPLTPQPG